FRHASWFVPEVYALLRAHGVALVIGDHPVRPFQTDERTADWAFVRFHYGSRGRGGNYSESELATWATRVAELARAGDVFCYFNNDWDGYAVKNGVSLRRILNDAGRLDRGLSGLGGGPGCSSAPGSGCCASRPGSRSPTSGRRRRPRRRSTRRLPGRPEAGASTRRIRRGRPRSRATRAPRASPPETRCRCTCTP